MSTLEIALTISVVWSAGALLVVLSSEKYDGKELAALAAWPVFLPLGVTLRAYHRWAFTCRDCKSYYGDRAHYRRHLVHRTGCTVPPTATTEGTP